MNVLDERVHSALLAESMGIPVLGLLPRATLASGAAFEHSEDYMDAIQAVRVRIMSAPEQPRVVLITSGTLGESKERFSSGLALSIAQLGKRVVIVQADLRRSGRESGLGSGGSDGLTGLLASGGSEDDQVRPTLGNANLYMLEAGAPPTAPAVLLASERMREMVDRLRASYDYVILDGPPAQYGASDIIVLAGLADCSIQVARLHTTTRTMLWRVHESLALQLQHSVGLVFSDVDRTSPAYREFYGYIN
jgi:capsular exopolysaccharide synthesis family protein